MRSSPRPIEEAAIHVELGLTADVDTVDGVLLLAVEHPLHVVIVQLGLVGLVQKLGCDGHCDTGVADPVVEVVRMSS